MLGRLPRMYFFDKLIRDGKFMDFSMRIKWNIFLLIILHERMDNINNWTYNETSVNNKLKEIEK